MQNMFNFLLFNAFNSLGNDNDQTMKFQIKIKLITISGCELIDPSLYILH